MYKEFDLLSIDAIASTKEIIITMNKDLDKNNYDNIVITILERTNKSPVQFDYEIDHEKIVITLKDWPVPNLDYILGIKGLLSVTEDTLCAMKKIVKFESDVLSKVKIISPIMFEEIQKLSLEIQEYADSDEYFINSYYIEISTDNAFYDLVNKTAINKTTADIFLKSHGQYYIRVRVQADEYNYSEWSPVVSFIYGGKELKLPPKEDDSDFDSIDTEFDDSDSDIDSDIDIDMGDLLSITEYPEQGITPEESFLFIFNNKINDLSVDEIVVTRSDVR